MEAKRYAVTAKTVEVLLATVPAKRMLLGTVHPSDVAIAAALTLASIALMVRLAGTIYENSILRMGSRVKLRDALRRADTRV